MQFRARSGEKVNVSSEKYVEIEKYFILVII
jgi:hypothetical protein